MIVDRRAFMLGCVGTALASSGCGYSLSGRGAFLPASIKIIGVPTFTNSTTLFEIETLVTKSVRSELSGRGHYTVLPVAEGVDALLSGEIASAVLSPVAFNTQQQASRIGLTVTVRIELRDVKANKVLWSNPGMQYSEQYDVSTASSALDPNAFLRQDTNALNRLTAELARAIVSAMLEAF